MPSQRSKAFKRTAIAIAIVTAVYGLLAYLLLPALWTHYERQPGLAEKPMLTRTGSGIPGDPINVGLVGDKDDVLRAMHAAGWYPADPITLRSSMDIIGSVLLHRPDKDAPVSPLYYDGRREDLAFEKEIGKSARQRHHARLWKVLNSGAEQRPVWLGSATFDEGVGVSRYTGQVTHVIAPSVDEERGFFAGTLMSAGMAETVYQVTGVGPTLNGRNGEGSRYFTDGEVRMIVLVPDGRRRTAPAEVLGAPPAVAAKDAVWQAAAGLLAN